MKTTRNDRDMVSRQSTIDALKSITVHDGTLIDHDSVLGMLMDLPSAQPEIIRCKDCKHDNNCAIQDIAQTGNKFFCGFAERREDGKTD